MKVQTKIAAVWGVGGVVLLLGFAVYRLTPFVVELADFELSWWQIVTLVLWCSLMAYSEGYKSFGKQFAPRVAARAQYLSRRTTWPRTILAPLFCIGYFGASKKRIITSVALVSGIIILIIAVHFVAQPWRGIIDAGVVLGLLAGIGYLLLYGYRAIKQTDYLVDPEVH